MLTKISYSYLLSKMIGNVNELAYLGHMLRSDDRMDTEVEGKMKKLIHYGSEA